MNPTVFSQADLDRHVAQLLPDAPPEGKHLAIVGDVTQDGIEAAAVYHFKDTWSFVGDYEHTWSGDNEFGAKVIGYF